jgi:phosphoribosyl-ATP pyrophosphohydrolase
MKERRPMHRRTRTRSHDNVARSDKASARLCIKDRPTDLAAMLGPVAHRLDYSTRPSADATAIVLEELYGALGRVTAAEHPRTFKVLRSGRRSLARDLIEEACEVTVEIVRRDARRIVSESADLLYQLVVLWFRSDIEQPNAALDDAHIGDIHGAFGTIRQGDHGPRQNWRARAITLLAILGPGLIVMVGDNDAGAFSTYSQAGQGYGTTLLWTLALLIPVLYVNLEMVLRLGAVSGDGHARLILERFGKFWGASSVIDLFLLNALTIVTEFIGVTLAFEYLGLSKNLGVLGAAALVMVAVSTGDFRCFERFGSHLPFL